MKRAKPFVKPLSPEALRRRLKKSQSTKEECACE